MTGSATVQPISREVSRYEELHVEMHYEGGGYWAHVRELPGCFATGDTLGELTEALESNVALYLTPTAETAADDSIEDEDDLAPPEDDMPDDDDYAEVPPANRRYSRSSFALPLSGP